MGVPQQQNALTDPNSRHGSNGNNGNAISSLTLSTILDAIFLFFGLGPGADDEDQFLPRLIVFVLVTLVFAGIVISSFSCISMWKIFRQKSASAKMSLRDKRK